MVTHFISLNHHNETVEWCHHCSYFISNDLRLRVAKLFVQKYAAKKVLRVVLRPIPVLELQMLGTLYCSKVIIVLRQRRPNC